MNSDDWQRQFWGWLDLRRDRGRPGLSDLIEFHREYGGSWLDVSAGMARLGQGAREFSGPPIQVADFLAGLANARGLRTLLDPFGTPVFDAALFSLMDAESGLTITPNADVATLGAALEPRLQWLVGWPEIELALDGPPSAGETRPTFDLIASAPPVGMRRSVGERPVASISDYAFSLLAALHTRLGEGGLIALVLPDSFFFSADAERAKEALAEHKIRFRAALSIEGGIPGTEVAANLCLFDREPPCDELFIGRLSSTGDNAALLNNLLLEAPAGTPALGAYSPYDTYRGWAPHSAEAELLQGISQANGQIARLSEVAVSITNYKVGPDDPPSNAVYLPNYPTAPATTTAPEDSARHVIEIVLDPEKASADYVAQWLNEPLGRTARRAMASGVAIPRVKAADAGRMSLVVPPLEQQILSSAASRQISLAASELEQLRTRIWNGQLSAKTALEIVKGIEAVQSPSEVDEPSMASTEQWVASLPFPLASIAHRYDAVADEAEKIDHLLHLFEAFAVFGTTALFSAVRRRPALYAQVVEKLRSSAKNGPLFERADYSTWITVGRTLCKSVRGELNNDGSGEIQASLFGQLSARLVEVILSKSAWEVMDTARTVRNQRAHGGIESHADRLLKLQSLEGTLVDLRTATAGMFEGTTLVRPGACAQDDDGTFVFPAAELLAGSNPWFRQESLRSADPMKASRLYLVDPNETISQPLELMPFITLSTPPQTEENAVFFYSRRSDDGVGYRYVSYHFAARPEGVFPNAEIDGILADLAPSDRP